VWQVRTETGETLPASLRGRLKQAETEKLAVGDNVVLERDERGNAWAIVEILPRRAKLARRTPGGGVGERRMLGEAAPDLHHHGLLRRA